MQYAGTGVGSAVKTVNEVQPISPLVQAAADIREGILRIHRVSGTAYEISSRLFGPPSEIDGNAKPGQPDTPPNGFIQDLTSAIQEMHKAIDGLEEQVARVSRI